MFFLPTAKKTNMEDRLTADDYAKYGGGGTYFASYHYEDKGKEEYDDDEDSFKRPLSKNSNSDFVSKKTRKTRDPNDVILREIEREPENLDRVLDLAGGHTGFWDAPIQESIALNKRIISYDVQHSATLLLDAHENKDIRLGYESHETMKKLAQCADEYTEVDPRVVIYDTFNTGVCKIYVKEVIPISILLLARHFNLDYTLQITADLESKPRSYKDIKIKAFHGGSTDHVQGLGCEEAVKKCIQGVTQWNLVKMYMIRVGAHSSTEIIRDFDWLENQTRAIGLVLARQAPKPSPVPQRSVGGGDTQTSPFEGEGLEGDFSL